MSNIQNNLITPETSTYPATEEDQETMTREQSEVLTQNGISVHESRPSNVDPTDEEIMSRRLTPVPNNAEMGVEEDEATLRASIFEHIDTKKKAEEARDADGEREAEERYRQQTAKLYQLKQSEKYQETSPGDKKIEGSAYDRAMKKLENDRQKSPVDPVETPDALPINHKRGDEQTTEQVSQEERKEDVLAPRARLEDILQRIGRLNDLDMAPDANDRVARTEPTPATKPRAIKTTNPREGGMHTEENNAPINSSVEHPSQTPDKITKTPQSPSVETSTPSAGSEHVRAEKPEPTLTGGTTANALPLDSEPPQDEESEGTWDKAMFGETPPEAGNEPIPETTSETLSKIEAEVVRGLTLWGQIQDRSAIDMFDKNRLQFNYNNAALITRPRVTQDEFRQFNSTLEGLLGKQFPIPEEGQTVDQYLDALEEKDEESAPESPALAA